MQGRAVGGTCNIISTDWSGCTAVVNVVYGIVVREVDSDMLFFWFCRRDVSRNVFPLALKYLNKSKQRNHSRIRGHSNRNNVKQEMGK